MFKSFAKIDAGRLHVRAATPSHSNDNRRRARLQPNAVRQLACRWQLNAATGRLECCWDLEAVGETAGAPARAGPVPLRRIGADVALAAPGGLKRGFAHGRTP
jgi:hypothetical protein